MSTHSYINGIMAIMSIAKQGAATINPFFFYFTRPYLLALLVGATMAGGVTALTFINLQCNHVVTSDTKYERVQAGSWLGLKLWAQEMVARPPALPKYVSYTVDLCAITYATPTFYKRTVNGEEYIEQSETCAPLCDSSPPAPHIRASRRHPVPHGAFPNLCSGCVWWLPARSSEH